VIRRLVALTLLTAGLTVAASAGPAEAAGTCTRSGSTVRIVAMPSTVTIGRAGRDLIVRGISGGPRCGGSTVDNTDRVVVTGSAAATVHLVVRQDLGGFAPGARPEAGSASEIEFVLDHGGPVVVETVGGPGQFVATGQGIRLNRDADVDVTGGPWPRLTLEGGNGRDTLRGRPLQIGTPYPGPMVIRGNGGDDIIAGGRADDVLAGGRGSDRLRDGAGDDVLWGGAGDDSLLSQTGQDALHGGAGADGATFCCGAGLVVDLAAGTATGLGSTDSLDGIENLYGTDQGDTFLGDDAANELDGGFGDDTIDGRGGGDDLVGSTGDDALDGGADTDTCDAGSDSGDTEVNCELP
jgi:Ca2+-binding RTX toxin-like protein